MIPTPELTDAIISGHVASMARLLDRQRGSPPASPQELGYLAELLVARHFAGAAWNDIPLALRRRIHGGSRGVTAGDRGVDVVAIAAGILTLIQVKWYGLGAAIGNDPFARLVSAGTACKKGFESKDLPAMKLVHQTGSRIAKGVVNRDMVIAEALTAEELGIGALVWGRPALPVVETDLPDVFEFDIVAWEAARVPVVVPTILAADPPQLLPDFDAFQSDIIDRARVMAADGRSLVRIQLPVGSGKSYVIAALAADYQTADAPVVVVAPRVEIVYQLADIIRAQGGWRQVHTVADGVTWPIGATGGEVVVITGQSITSKLFREGSIRTAAMFFDEAHNLTGHSRARSVFVTPVRYDLSACLGGKPADIRVDHRRAVELGLICAAEFVFAVFPRAPTPDDFAAHLVAHPEHASVLACFQSRGSAREFARACENAQIDVETYVSGDIESDALERFRRGDIRVLCVVARAEMGVNIHRCDTVLLAEPWNSSARTLQLIGRGCRLFPTKNGHFSVLCGVGPDDVVEKRVTRLVETIHAECDAFHATSFDELADCVDIVAGVGSISGELKLPLAIAPIEALDAVRREVFDAFGHRLHVEDPAAALLLRYQRAREIAVQAGLKSYNEYATWRIGLSDEQRNIVPLDPATEFAKLPAPKFPWVDYLGLPPPRDLAAGLAAAIGEAMENEIMTIDDMGTPSSDLYDMLRTETKFGKMLPLQPLIAEETWAGLFATIH